VKERDVRITQFNFTGEVCIGFGEQFLNNGVLLVV
jgi:hypothetical protein